MQATISKIEKIIFSLLFVIAFGFQPLFFSNQNTKFLHGVANSGYGVLHQDWLANTVDPLPIFSKLIEWIFVLEIPLLTFVIQGFCVLVFAYYSFSLAIEALQLKRNHFYWLCALLFFVYSPVIVDDIFWGFSGQYLITQYLQPSSFAVFYMPAIYYAYRRKFLVSGIFMGIPGLFHAAYTLVGAVLFVCCFTYFLWKENKWVPTILAGLLFSAVMLPAVVTQLSLLKATNSNLTIEAMAIISNYRIPHHTSILSIFRFDFFIKAIIIGLCIWKVQQTFLKWLIVTLTGLLVAAILYGVLNQNAVVSVSTPWRFSVIVVPLGILGLSAIAAKGLSALPQQLFRIVPIIIVLIFSALGVNYTFQQNKNFTQIDGYDTLLWLKDNQKNFEQAQFLVESKPAYSEVFRLVTGLPIFVNWKTHPYKDVEVIEWYKRMQLNEAVYNNEITAKEFTELLNTYGITHIVIPKDQTLQGNIVHSGEFLKIVAVN